MIHDVQHPQSWFVWLDQHSQPPLPHDVVVVLLQYFLWNRPEIEQNGHVMAGAVFCKIKSECI